MLKIYLLFFTKRKLLDLCIHDTAVFKVLMTLVCLNYFYSYLLFDAIALNSYCRSASADAFYGSFFIYGCYFFVGRCVGDCFGWGCLYLKFSCLFFLDG